MALAINKDNFEALVAGDQPVVIDFWAEWSEAPWEQTDRTELLENVCRAKEAGVSDR